ncbi:glycosyltransferase [Homoserinimonas sp. OAct 916]|uniref:glycosyltransferase n=1 Tax=Homoserinimonas sp. OAct 916 TaxID=2211450 RepID=UPI000DBE1973|nr:glycosyltransferase [Homoserinimonas sp. OAct 916]
MRIASVPSDHVYVRHLSPPDGNDRSVTRLPDPTPPGAESEPSRWWPPTMLQADWVREHHREFDVFHVHFGFDARAPEDLQELVTVLRQNDKPLVLTMHDLRNPHHHGRKEHDAQLDVLVPAADALITLTGGAGDEIKRRWGRNACVIPHPHVVELDRMSALRAERSSGNGTPYRVGMHVKSLRACMDPSALLPALERAVIEMGDARLQINGHRDVLDPRGERYDPDLAQLLHDCGDLVDVRIHDFFDDEALWRYLSSIDVSVLPYRFGTHSGWLEACRDLGTRVVAPSCGYYAEQGPVQSYVFDEDGFDETTLIDAVLGAREMDVEPLSALDRLGQRRAISAAHRDLYDSLLR